MNRIALTIGAISLAISASPLTASKKFVPPPMPAGYDDPGEPPANPVAAIAAGLRTSLKDAYSAREFSLCSQGLSRPIPPFSDTESWERAQRLIYFLVNAKNSYGAYTGVQEGIAAFVDGHLVHISLITIGDQYPRDQEAMAKARGECHSVPDEDIQRLIRAAN